MHAQDFHALGQYRVVRHAHTGVPERPEILGWEEREATDIAVAAGTIVFVILCTDGLGGVFDYPQSVASRGVE